MITSQKLCNMMGRWVNAALQYVFHLIVFFSVQMFSPPPSCLRVSNTCTFHLIVLKLPFRYFYLKGIYTHFQNSCYSEGLSQSKKYKQTWTNLKTRVLKLKFVMLQSGAAPYVGTFSVSELRTLQQIKVNLGINKKASILWVNEIRLSFISPRLGCNKNPSLSWLCFFTQHQTTQARCRHCVFL